MSNFDGVLNTGLAKFSGIYLDARNKMSPFQFATEYINTAKTYAELFEQLLLFNRVSIVLDPMDNSAIAALASGLGLEELERALALEAIEIIQPRVLSMAGMGQFGMGQKDADLLTGLPPVVYGRITSGVYGDPEEAILDSFKYLQGIPPKEQKAFARRVAGYIKPGPIDNANRAVKIVTDAYNSDILRRVGVPNNAVITTLDAQTRLKIQQFISEIERSIFVADNNYGLYNTPAVYSLLKDAVGMIDDALQLQRSNDAILNGIKLPNLRVVFMSGRASLEDAMQLREGRENIAFRHWLQTVSNPNDAALVMRDYIEAVSKPIGFSETIPGQLLKGVTMFGIGKLVSAAGAIVGGALGGPIGAVVGATTGAAATPVIAGAVEIASNQFLDRLSNAVYHGWTPKHFVDQVKNLAEPQVDLKRLGM